MNHTCDSDSPMVHWEGGLKPRIDIVLKIYVGHVVEDGLEGVDHKMEDDLKISRKLSKECASSCGT